jgi:hypothetical protein
MRLNAPSHLLCGAVLALFAVALATSSVARAEAQQVTKGKKASLALFERVFESRTGDFCGATLSDVTERTKDDGSLELMLTNDRPVPESRLLQTARALRSNRSVMALYCDRSGEHLIVTGVILAHGVHMEKSYWTARLERIDSNDPPKGPLQALSDVEVIATLRRQAREMNESLPKMLGSKLRYDSVKSSGKSLLQTFTVVVAEAASTDVEGFRRATKASLVPGMCEDQRLEPLLRGGARLGFRYLDKDGVEIATITVVDADCAVRTSDRDENTGQTTPPRSHH